jgi:hypothetical protein
MLTNSEEGEEEKLWNFPIIFQHNKIIDKVYIEVDRKRRDKAKV